MACAQSKMRDLSGRATPGEGRRGKYLWDCKVGLLCEPKRQWPLNSRIMPGRASGRRNLGGPVQDTDLHL